MAYASVIVTNHLMEFVHCSEQSYNNQHERTCLFVLIHEKLVLLFRFISQFGYFNPSESALGLIIGDLFISLVLVFFFRSFLDGTLNSLYL